VKLVGGVKHRLAFGYVPRPPAAAAAAGSCCMERLRWPAVARLALIYFLLTYASPAAYRSNDKFISDAIIATDWTAWHWSALERADSPCSSQQHRPLHYLNNGVGTLRPCWPIEDY